MKKRGFLSALSIGAAAAFFSPGLLRAEENEAKKPNIVLILVDDMGWGDIGYYGSRIKTPALDALARHGARLDRFYVAPMCSATRAALMTGRYPIRYGLQSRVIRAWADYGVSTNEMFLSREMKKAGYTTVICGKWHLGCAKDEYRPTRRGFDHQYGCFTGHVDPYDHSQGGGKDWNRNDEPVDEKGHATDLITDECVKLIEAQAADTPLFLYVPFTAPHSPHDAPEEYLEKYVDIKDDHARRYAAMITHMDAAVKRIVEALQKKGMMKNTLLFFASDNGAPGGEKYTYCSNGPWRAGKGRLYEGGVRVPAFMVWPGHIKPGTVVDEPLHIVDLYPTLCDVAGVHPSPPKPLDGHDIMHCITDGAKTPHSDILLNVSYKGGLVMGDWKLKCNAHSYQECELYNLKKDPKEEHDVAKEHPLRVKKMQAVLRRYRTESAKALVPGERRKCPGERWWQEPVCAEK